jgi:transposase
VVPNPISVTRKADTSMTEPAPGIYGGVDTHKTTHVAAVVDQTGRILDVESFAASAAGYRQLLAWMRRHGGDLVRVGIEGTGSYGAGLARYLAGQDVEIVEVNRPNRQARRRRGKNDTVDAEAAARAALNGDATAIPKTHDGAVESIRAIRVAFTSTRNARTRIANQLRDLVVCAPDQLRRDLEPLDTDARAERAAHYRPGDLTDPVEGTKAALRALARQHQALTTDLDELRSHLDQLTRAVNPALVHAVGVGPDVASILLITAGDNPDRLASDAAFAAVCGASPIEASSGKTTRHRLNRGGNRNANHALWRIVMVRLTCHPPTKAYAARRRAEGKTTREIIRCLKRYVAREIYRLLTDPPPIDDPAELRAARITAGITLTDAARHLDVHLSTLSRIEHGHRRDDELMTRYRAWLHEQNAA